MTFVVYEDRPSEFVGIQVLLRSVAKHQPDWSAIVFLPGAPKELCEWCESQSLRSVRVVTDVTRRGWNSKPHCLLAALSEGLPEVVWLDSDIALAGPIDSMFKRIPLGTVIAAEEAPWFNEQGTRLRTEGWGFEVGRALPISINSCAMRFDSSHRELLETWNELLQSETYIAAQRMNWPDRPVHMKSDQDILNALLGSAKFANTPLVLLKNGVEIAQCFEEDGYRVGARLTHAFRALPPLVHTQGSKPWRDYGKRFKRIWVELSPYTWAAQQVCADMPEISTWAHVRMPLARLLNAIALGDPSLRGIFPAMIRTTIRLIGRPLRSIAQKLRNVIVPRPSEAKLRTSP